MFSDRTTPNNAEREVETKIQLNEADFDRLKQLGRVERCRDQLNVYFDWSGELARRAATCRIRFSSGGKQPVMTLKLPSHVSGATRHALEFEREIAGSLARAKCLSVERDLPRSVGKELHAMGITQLNRLGWMRTRRWEVVFGGNLKVEMDEVRLPNGRMFFEVEVETLDAEARRQAESFVRNRAASAQSSLVSKYERFLAATEPTPEERPNASAI